MMLVEDGEAVVSICWGVYSISFWSSSARTVEMEVSKELTVHIRARRKALSHCWPDNPTNIDSVLA